MSVQEITQTDLGLTKWEWNGVQNIPDDDVDDDVDDDDDDGEGVEDRQRKRVEIRV